MKPTIVLCAAVLALAGCANPIDRVARLSEVELAEAPATVEMAEPASEAEAETQGGLFARLLRPRTTAPRQTPDDDSGAEAGNADAADPAEDATPRRRGLLAFLRPADATEEQKGEPFAETGLSETAATEAATDGTPSETASQPVQRRGLFGLFANAARDDANEGVEVASLDPNAPDGRLATPGVQLPYGIVARACDIPRRQLGREVAKYPESNPVYRLFDSDPGNTAPHTFFLTGFPDGCARQFTGALALFGSPAMHEQLRYGAPAKSLPYSDTDKAYEKIKRTVCGVGRNKPCGSRVSRLERDTAFISVYEHFGDSPRWATILVHDGRVVARDVKSGG